MSKNSATPGIHPSFRLNHFSDREEKILEIISRDWYVTRDVAIIKIGGSEYHFFLIKACGNYIQMFNLEREIICLFSPYKNFEPRTLDAFASAIELLPALRTEDICRILISEDPEIENRVEGIIKANPDQPIVIPLSYSEIIEDEERHLIGNRFRKHFFNRNLFEFLSPLKSDLFFFGRNQLVQEIVDRHKSAEHTGLFGLRKSGKTSVIYAVERVLKSCNGRFVSVDCESPSIHKLRWFELLEKLIHLYTISIESRLKISTDGRYTEKTASESFEIDCKKVYESKGRIPTLIIFDEIERITPGTASSEHWRVGDDFIYFWQTMRAFFQRNHNVITYMLVGTNPKCIESPVLNGQDNPIYKSIPSHYVPPFSLDQTEEMVSRLGNYMGLEFDPHLYGSLNGSFGGHPFLIRLACSLMFSECSENRPAIIDKSVYSKMSKSFLDNNTEYLDMMVHVLKEWYPDEYDLLVMLANDDIDYFDEFARDNLGHVKHLIGYGLIQKGVNGFTFNIECLKEYILKSHKFRKLNPTNTEMISEISVRRNELEKNLRQIARQALKFKYGKKASEKLLAVIPAERRSKILDTSLESVLAVGQSPLFLLDLIHLLNEEWVCFENIIEIDKPRLLLALGEINKNGRPDAHAKSVSKELFDEIRVYLKMAETSILSWIKGA